MARLLVSVRSVDEAKAALEGGAAVIDVKEPDRGSLGRANASVWHAVRRVVPADIPVSVALGELPDWLDCEPPLPRDFAGVTYRKLGLAGAGTEWLSTWEALRGAWGPGPSWIAVAYADWQAARAPHPDDVLDAALSADDCAGVLVDTWDKSRSSLIDSSWQRWIDRARAGGRTVALAGGLDADMIARLAPLSPDLFAVRGAACLGGDRRATINADLVAGLVRAAAG